MIVFLQALNPPPAPPPGFEGLASQFLGWLKWIVLASGLAGLFLCSIMLILGRRNRSSLAYEGLLGSAWVLAGLGMGSIAAILVGAFQL
jgi:formate hydrogenlyase subunit 3/multisubunit Na+/H+ antiporter MnhD subunit